MTIFLPATLGRTIDSINHKISDSPALSFITKLDALEYAQQKQHDRIQLFHKKNYDLILKSIHEKIIQTGTWQKAIFVHKFF